MQIDIPEHLVGAVFRLFTDSSSAWSESSPRRSTAQHEVVASPHEVRCLRPGRRPRSMVGTRVRVTLTWEVVRVLPDGRLQLRVAEADRAARMRQPRRKKSSPGATSRRPTSRSTKRTPGR